MAYDPCGSEKLEGEDILKLLAKELGASPHGLKGALLSLLQQYEIEPEDGK